MRDIIFFTDPHLGLKRSSGTTARSQKLFQEALYEAAMSILREQDGIFICLGDLFDQSSNEEEVILQGYNVASRCELVLAGNHDVFNRTDKVSSLELVHKMFKEAQAHSPVVISPNPGMTYFSRKDVGDLHIFSVPHCLTQEIFAESVRCVASEAESWDGKKILLLHCNVGEGMGKLEDDSSSLWLTPELEEIALSVFDKVLVGHEHEPKELRQGRLVILGNTMPVSYGEISERFYYKMNSVTTELQKIKTYDPATSFLSIQAGTFIELGGKMEIAQTMVEVVGDIEERNLAALGRAMIKAWANNPSLISLKKSVNVIKAKKLKQKAEGSEFRSLLELVRDAVDTAGYGPEFGEICDD